MVETTEEYRNRINQLKTNIENEPYIKEMREDIAEGIFKTGNRQADIEDQFQEVIDNTTGKDVIAAPELIAARNGKPNLKTRIDDLENETNRQLGQTEDNVNRRVDELVIESGNANAEVTDAHVSTVKNKTFPTLRKRFEETERGVSFPAENKIVNGNFDKESLNDARWYAQYSNLETSGYSENVYTYVVDTPHSAARLEKGTATHVLGHIYYVRGYIKPQRQAETKVSLGNKNGNLFYPAANQWTLINSVITPTDSTTPFRFHHNTNNYLTGEKIEFKLISVLDLTEIFGVGNEITDTTELERILSKYANGFFDGIVDPLVTLKTLYTSSVKSDVEKEPLEVIAPKKVYVVANDIGTIDDFGKNRQYSSALHLDHMVKDTKDKEMKFADYPTGEGDKYYFYNPSQYNGNVLSINSGSNVSLINKPINITSEKHALNIPSIAQYSTKASVSKLKKPRVLFIGDSITAGIGSRPYYGNGELPYWGYVKQFFNMDKIDGGNVSGEYEFMSLGVKNFLPVKTTYKDVTLESMQSADGISSWSLFNFLHHAELRQPSQATWDLLGLGNGTGTDYTGSQVQKDLIASTNETNPTTTPQNPYFDNDKTGEIKFSISKWLQRKRTRDDNGNKLTLSSPELGTDINAQWEIDNYNVCTPTHVVIALGRNDLAYCSVGKFISNLKLLVDNLRAEIPNAIIGVSTVPDNPGTFFPERYPKIVGDIKMAEVHQVTYDAVKSQLSNFEGRESEKVHLIPNYFVQPTAWSFMLQEVGLPESDLGVAGWQQEEFKRYRPLGDGLNNHLGSQGHIAWAYQVYAWLKYVMSI